MSTPRLGVSAHRRPVLPLWLVVALFAPLGLVFLTSLVLALSIAGVVALAIGARPFLRRQPTAQRGDDTIELDSSQYRRLGSTPPRDDR